MTPGMASLIMQVQVFFSLFFGAVFLNEKPNAWQIIGALVSFSGISLVALHLDQTVTLVGFLCILASASSWGFGTLITKKIKNVNMFSLVIWGCFVACPPMFILSLLFEGPASIVHSYQHTTWIGITSLFYVVYISTWAGYGLWNWLIGRYPISMVVPFTLLIPIVGMLSSILMLGEPFERWKLLSGLLVISGLYINLLSARWLKERTRTLQETC